MHDIGPAILILTFHWQKKYFKKVTLSNHNHSTNISILANNINFLKIPDKIDKAQKMDLLYVNRKL